MLWCFYSALKWVSLLLILQIKCHRPSQCFLLRCREHEKMKKWVPGEETGRAVGTVTLLLGSDGDIEIELESSPKGFIWGRKDREIPAGIYTQSSRRGVLLAGRENQQWRQSSQAGSESSLTQPVSLKSHLGLVNFNQSPQLQWVCLQLFSLSGN